MGELDLLNGEVSNLRMERVGVYFGSTCGMEAQVRLRDTHLRFNGRYIHHVAQHYPVIESLS